MPELVKIDENKIQKIEEDIRNFEKQVIANVFEEKTISVPLLYNMYGGEEAYILLEPFHVGKNKKNYVTYVSKNGNLFDQEQNFFDESYMAKNIILKNDEMEFVFCRTKKRFFNSLEEHKSIKIQMTNFKCERINNDTKVFELENTVELKNNFNETLCEAKYISLNGSVYNENKDICPRNSVQNVQLDNNIIRWEFANRIYSSTLNPDTCYESSLERRDMSAENYSVIKAGEEYIYEEISARINDILKKVKNNPEGDIASRLDGMQNKLDSIREKYMK